MTANKGPPVSDGSGGSSEKRLANLRRFRPGQSGNPRGSSQLQRLRNELLKLEPKAMKFVERALDGDLNALSYNVLRLTMSLAYPEEWKLGVAIAEQMPPTINAPAMPATAEVQELKRVIVEAVATYAKQKEVLAGGQLSTEELVRIAKGEA